MRAQERCICPHSERSLGRLLGVNMGRGVVRLATTPGCPEHDSCRHWTAEQRKERPLLWCPKHGSKSCPDLPEGTQE